MTWPNRLVRVWFAVVLTACGCVAKPSLLSALPPSNSGEARVAGAPARAQKPEATSPPESAFCLINQPVSRPAEATHASPVATICAVVNGEPIFAEEVRMSCIQQWMTARSDKERDEIFRQARQKIIDREVLLQDAFAKLEKGGKQGAKFRAKLEEEARKEFEKHWVKPIMKGNHIESRDDFADFLERNHLSLPVMRRWFERNFMANQYLGSRVEPYIRRIGHTEITEYYNSHREEYTQPDSVKWQDIFIDARQHASRRAARQFAESLLQRVHQGEDFAKLSWEFDNGTSGHYRKGDGEGRKRGEIRPREAEEELFRMHDGEARIIERDRGFHIVHLVKRQYAGPIEFDAKVQKEINDKLRVSVFMREKESVEKELKRKAVIDINDSVGSNP